MVDNSGVISNYYVESDMFENHYAAVRLPSLALGLAAETAELEKAINAGGSQLEIVSELGDVLWNVTQIYRVHEPLTETRSLEESYVKVMQVCMRAGQNAAERNWSPKRPITELRETVGAIANEVERQCRIGDVVTEKRIVALEMHLIRAMVALAQITWAMYQRTLLHVMFQNIAKLEDRYNRRTLMAPNNEGRNVR